MKVLLMYEGFDEYTVQLWENIKKLDPQIHFSLLTTRDAEKQYRERIDIEPGEIIYTESDKHSYFPFNTLSIIRNLPQYDIIHISYIELKWGIVAPALRKKCKKLIISVGGSDMYRVAKKVHKRLIQLRLLKRADIISSENSQTRSTFYKVYGKKIKNIPHYIVRYGVNVIDAIRECRDSKDILRKKWDIPEDKEVVMLGYNGSRNQQHLKLVDAIKKIDRKTLDRCFFLIPMTYLVPNRKYRALVEEKVAEVTDSYRFYDDYLNVSLMAELTILTDVMIHVQTTDQLSSSMMAHLFCENIVIAGSWLPYNDITDAGIHLFRVDDIDAITELLAEIVRGPNDYKSLCRENKRRTYRFSSWECCANQWLKLYKGDMTYGNSV